MTEGTVTLNMAQDANNERTSKMVLYIGIFSIVMLFAGLSSAFVISSYGELWVNIAMPTAFYISTVLILLSSLTMHLAVKASNAGKSSQTGFLLGLTLFLGIGFAISQVAGWSEMIKLGSHFSSHVDSLNGEYGADYTITYQGQELVYENNNYYFPNDELREKPLADEIAIQGNSASSYIYLLSFVHLLHLAGGLLFLLAIFIIGRFSKTGKINNLRLRLGAFYWHFVDGLWLYLFLFLLLIH